MIFKLKSIDCRLEQGMVAGRRWTADEFQAYLAGHPLLGSVVTMLVWIDHGQAGGAAAFRVDEGGASVDGSGAGCDSKRRNRSTASMGVSPCSVNTSRWPSGPIMRVPPPRRHATAAVPVRDGIRRRHV